MSYISVEDFGRIRKSVSKRRQEIVTEIMTKKVISKTQCLKYVEDICDLIITYDPVLTLSTPEIQPFVKLVDIDVNNRMKASLNSSTDLTKTKSTPKTVSTQVIVVDDEEETNTEITVAKTSASDNRPAKENVRYKGVIRGMDSLNSNDWDDDWSQTDTPPKSPPKKARTTRSQSKRQSSKVNTTVEEKDSDDWSSGGQVLGGDTNTKASTSMSQEEMRRLRAEKTEQRLAQQTKRGSKGVVNLTARAQADISAPTPPSKSNLKWKM